MRTLLKLALACMLGAMGVIGAFLVVVALITLVGSAFAQEVQPVREARLSDYDSPDYYRDMPIARPIDLSELHLGVVLLHVDKVPTCEEYNDVVIAQVRMIAWNIAYEPEKGAIYKDTILFWYSELNEDCL